MNVKKKIKIGTRQSPLAMAQAHMVRDLLVKHSDVTLDAIEICPMTTTGDQIQDKALRAFGGKGLFTKEIEQSLLDKTTDLAVHSMKDVQTKLPDGLHIPAILKRAPAGDVFLSPHAETLDSLPKGAKLGTSSLRRAAQIKAMRPDLEIVPFRGNVQTRLKKLADGVADATLLAHAGLVRLKRDDLIQWVIPVDVMLPAPAQGAIGIECRSDDKRVTELLAGLNHEPTAVVVAAERAFLTKLDGSCHTPLAALATLDGDRLEIKGEILSVDGAEKYSAVKQGSKSEAALLGTQLAASLMDEAGEAFLKAFHEGS